MMLSVGILSIVSLLGFVVLRSSNESARMTEAQAAVQQNLRNCMAALTAELRAAYTTRVTNSAAWPSNKPAAIAVTNGGKTVTFQKPSPSNTTPIPLASTPITISFQNEDASAYGTSGYARLDSGEDTNGDGVLTRRLVRTQGGSTSVIGASNDLSLVQFTLEPNLNTKSQDKTTLRIRLQSAKRFGANGKYLVRAELESSIHLEN
jgi:type II secretory pathway pseudopilin PulG